MNRSKTENVRVIDHPLIQEKLTLARDRETDHEQFRRLIGEIAQLMVFEVAHDFPTRDLEVMTPMAPFLGKELAKDITLVPILRAGLGMIDGILDLIPRARVGHIGIYRDAETLEPVAYYDKLPADIGASEVIVIDPILATGGSTNKALSLVRQAGGKSIRLLCLVAAPEGIAAVTQQHPDVPIITAGVDDCLDDHGYVIPGLGDAGDRIFGTH